VRNKDGTWSARKVAGDSGARSGNGRVPHIPARSGPRGEHTRHTRGPHGAAATANLMEPCRKDALHKTARASTTATATSNAARASAARANAARASRAKAAQLGGSGKWGESNGQQRRGWNDSTGPEDTLVTRRRPAPTKTGTPSPGMASRARPSSRDSTPKVVSINMASWTQ
jgi:hypothetical protein